LECKNGATIMESNMEFLQKKKIELSFDLADPCLFGDIFKRIENKIMKNICKPMFGVAFFTIPRGRNKLNNHLQKNE
jgi:hypothetical protein